VVAREVVRLLRRGSGDSMSGNRERERLIDALLAGNERLEIAYKIGVAENERLREALEQAQSDLEAILPPRGHEELAQGVYFAHKRVEKALAGDAE
jgi:hypothetical protein